MTLPNVQSIEERRASKVNEIKHLYAFGAKLNNPQLYNNSSSKILSFYFSIRRIYQEEGCQWKITTNQISEGCLWQVHHKNSANSKNGAKMTKNTDAWILDMNQRTRFRNSQILKYKIYSSWFKTTLKSTIKLRKVIQSLIVFQIFIVWF